MSDGPKQILFRSPEELRVGHPDIDFSLVVTDQNYKDLVAAYRYGLGSKHPKEHCQLLNKNERCNTPHFNGWVVVTKDDRKGLIGKNCAQNHFGAEFRGGDFQKQVRRMRNLVRLQQRRESLQSARERWPEARIRKLLKGVQALRRDSQVLKRCIPDELRKPITDRTKTGRTVITIQIHRPEKDEEGNVVFKWHSASWGSISGLGAMDRFPSERDVEFVAGADKALTTPDESTSSITDLDWAISILNRLDEIERECSNVRRQVTRFREPDNLKLLSLLVRNHKVKRQFAASLIREYGSEYFGAKTAREFLRSIDSEIRKEHANLNWQEGDA